MPLLDMLIAGLMFAVGTRIKEQKNGGYDDMLKSCTLSKEQSILPGDDLRKG